MKGVLIYWQDSAKQNRFALLMSYNNEAKTIVKDVCVTDKLQEAETVDGFFFFYIFTWDGYYTVQYYGSLTWISKLVVADCFIINDAARVRRNKKLLILTRVLKIVMAMSNSTHCWN